MTRQVHEFRLAGLSAADALHEADRLVRDRSVPDLSCLLVLDDAVTLPGHRAAIEHLLASGRVPHFICLATGRPGDDGLLQLVSNVSAWRDSALLWIGDRLGVDWVPGAPAIDLLHPADGPDGLHRLTEILSSVEVYERVREVAAEVPHGVACPGLRLAESAADGVSFAAVLSEAIDRIEPRQGTASPAGQPFRDLPAGRQASAVLSEHGDLARTVQRCASAADAADRALGEVARLDGLLGPGRSPGDTRDLVTVAGTALGQLRSTVSALLESIPVHSRLDRQALDRLTERLRRAGVNLGPAAMAGPGPAGHGPAAEETARSSVAVAQAVATSLREGQSLAVVSGRLAATERLLGPTATEPAEQRVAQRCPPALVGRLSSPAPFPRAAPWLPLLGALATALAATSGIVAAVAAAAVWIILASLAAHRAAGAAGEGQRGVVASVLPDVAGVLLGAVAGRALAAAAHPAVPVATAAVILAAVIIIAAAVGSWRARAARWRRALLPAQAGQAAQALADLVLSTASTVQPADADLLDSVARARIVTEALRDQLRGYAGQYGGAAVSTDAARLGPGLVPGLRELAAAVVFTQLALPARDGEAVREGTQEKAAELLTVWADHATERGLLAPPGAAWASYAKRHWLVELPPFPAADGTAQVPFTPAWQDSIRAAVGGDPHGLMWQLCEPGDIALLDTGGPIPTVAFAPQATRAGLAGLAPPATEWTAHGQRAGLLRLVPIRLAAMTPQVFLDDEQEQPT